jgi:hypothetical protein
LAFDGSLIVDIDSLFDLDIVSSFAVELDDLSFEVEFAVEFYLAVSSDSDEFVAGDFDNDAWQN